MARRRFFVPEVRRGLAELTGEDAEHLVRVLRAEVGQLYEISDNQRLFVAEITTARKSLVTFEVREELPIAAPGVHLILMPALIKFERFEWMIEKATELGVAEIRPVIATLTEHGLDRAAAKRSSRWEKIALEASQQARRVHLPLLHPPVRFTTAVEIEASVRVFLDEDPIAPPLLDQLSAERKFDDTVAILLGPEGGWTDEERDSARDKNWKFASLGRTVLRAETAAIAALATTQAVWEQMHS